jgi:hypothetical protein
MTTHGIMIERRAVLLHLKKTSTDWPELKSWFSRNKYREFAPSAVARRVGIPIALWAMRTVPGTERKARELAAAFAYGPDGKLAEAYRSATGGCSMFDAGLDLLLRWLAGDVTDADAATMRWALSTRAMQLTDGTNAALQSLICAFAPHAWGGCGTAHERALEAHGILLARENDRASRKEAIANAWEYHAFLIEDLLG